MTFAPTAAPAAPTTPNLARSLHELGRALEGQLVLPGSDDYEAGRQVHNLLFQRHPVAIVRPATTVDVALAVRFARDNGLPIAVRSGGHSVAGHSTTDGVVIDLAKLRGLDVDPVTRTVRAQTGLRAGDVTTAAAEHGLAVPFGDTGSVGLGGLTLGGGIGFLVRKHGMTIDNLLEVELVTADGAVVTASATQNPDLFWALRGGGGNFGMVTAFTYRAVPVGMIYGGLIALPVSPEILRAYVAAAQAAPVELTMIAFVTTIPPMPFVAPDLVGRMSLIAFVAYAGDPANGPAALAPIRDLATPYVDMLQPMPYAALYQLTAQGEQAASGVMRAAFLRSMDDAAEAILAHMETASSPFAFAQIRVLGGAMAQVPADATAFAHRDASILFAIMASFEGDDPTPHAAWADAFFRAIRPATDGVYANFLEDEGDGRIHEAYPADTYARLAAVKATWDPENVFHLNQNVAPAAS
jgi:FAD/FMN-containing dehydrogenase